MGASMCRSNSQVPEEALDCNTWSGGPRSSKAYAAGDVVEECLCLECEWEEVDGTAFEGHTFPLLNRSTHTLLPLGLGMLYCQSSEASLKAEYFQCSGRPWIRFTAARAMKAGEPLTVSNKDHRDSDQSLMDVAQSYADLGSWTIQGRYDWARANMWSYAGCPTPDHPLDPAAREASLRMGESKLGGFGVFARRPYSRGELVEAALSVPVVNHDSNAMNGYCFDANEFWFQPKRGLTVDAFNMGLAMIYNHSQVADNMHFTYVVSDGLVLNCFFTTRDIEEGEELLYDYGDEYWEGREFREPDTVEAD